ncbi:MAG: UDP-N-acetylglucosamine diphosphorylase [Bacillota bacterium]|nr:UDP-N-acetylglucosamine diphosphorylase [Bacillota bacterium]
MQELEKTIEELRAAEQEKEEARLRINLEHIRKGVVFVDWKAAYIDASVSIGEGTVVYPGTILERNTTIGAHCIIGPETRISQSRIGDRVAADHSVILESQVEDGAKIGPFAYLRPGSRIGENVKIGDFVEVKNSTLGRGSKASHLTYIGDSDVGENVNLGCGVVFVNYDGSQKYRSVVEDGAFIGCNVNLISPVKVGEQAYVAAGTTVTGSVPAGALCIGRTKERHIADWVRRRGIFKKEK